MTLTIEIKNLNYVEATEITKTVSNAVHNIEIDRASLCAEKTEDPQMIFEFDHDAPAQVFRGEESTFSRYINGTKKP